MQKIIPCIWFDNDAEEAVNLYAKTFPDSTIGRITHYGKEGFDVHHMPDGAVLTMEFTVSGFSFLALNGGSDFKPNPSISFNVKLPSESDVDRVWNVLSKDGKALMELGKYPWSNKYGWVQDKYGVSWQITVAPQPIFQKVIPVLMFTKNNAGNAEEAVHRYASIFKDGKATILGRYGKEQEPDKEGTVSYADYYLEGIQFGAMDSLQPHQFVFSEGVSLIVRCKDQKEVDYYWEKLLADGGKPSQCGWLYDKYGVSWQVTPVRLDELMSDPDPVKAGKAMNAMLPMQKIDIEKIEMAVNA